MKNIINGFYTVGPFSISEIKFGYIKTSEMERAGQGWTPALKKMILR